MINGEHYSGAERVQDLLASRLPEFGYQVSFACVKPGKFDEQRKYRDAALWNVPMKHRFDLRSAKRIADWIRQHETRLVHAHTPRSALVGGIAARMCGVPLVFHVHSPTSRDSTRWLINWLNQKVENWSIRNAAGIIAVSASLKEHMIGQGWEAARINVVPNGVPVQPVRPRRCNSSGLVIGTVALFRPRKGTEVLLQALADLRTRHPDVRLLAVGPFESPEYEARLKQLARELNIEQAIEWTGFCSDIADRFAQMDTFALPSLFGEGLPMVVLEAMSHGVPVVASNVEGIPQAIREGQDGLLVRAGDAEDLGRGLEQLLTRPDLRESLSQSAYRRQQESFSDVSMARGLARVYDEILRSRVGDDQQAV